MPQELKAIWHERRLSQSAVDLSGVWRFRDLLPALESDDHAITLREGNTPLYELPQCARIAGVPRLLAKHQGLNPTGSFKDARHDGGGDVSRGLRDFAGSRALQREILRRPWPPMPRAEACAAWCWFPKEKFPGANFRRRSTMAPSPASCALTLMAACGCCRNWFCGLPVYQLNSINPFRLEGQKTLALELMEQLDWQPPDHIIVPGGNLGNSSAIGKALMEMRDLGLISRLPKLSVIQAEGANALVRTLREAGGKRLVNVQAETRATAIRIGNPASWKKAVHVLEATGGACEQVSEIEIAQAKAEIGAEGIGCEPASAVTLAG